MLLLKKGSDIQPGFVFFYALYILKRSLINSILYFEFNIQTYYLVFITFTNQI